MGKSLESFHVIDICAAPTAEYVLRVLAWFNRGIKEVFIRAIDENSSRAMKTRFILSHHFSITPGAPRIFDLELEDLEFSCLEISHVFKESSCPQVDSLTTNEVVEFPVYHLLLDLLLAKEEGFEVYTQWKGHEVPLLTVEVDKVTGYTVEYTGEKVRELLNSLTSALYRCGFLLSPYWKEVALKISQFDDVILGVDTNVLLAATLTEHLFNHLSITDVKKYVSTPNWLLVVVPSAVMHELEQGANLRERGYLTDKGRVSYRGLQEILDIDRRQDLSGVSLLIVGESNPVLDTRVELRRLREEIGKEAKVLAEVAGEKATVWQSKPSSGDMIIRDQFKHFLKQIDFHKGLYFVTSDKSNAALARAEGLNSIYYRFPPWQSIRGTIRPPAIPCKGESKELLLEVPLGKLIYELAVQFGLIKIPTEFGEIVIVCDQKGETLDHWIFRDLWFTNGLESLVDFYKKEGRISLKHVSSVWRQLVEREAE